MKLSFDHLQRCSLTLERSLQSLGSATPGSLDAEVARNAVIKSFELALEVSVQMLSESLKMSGSMTFKELFREGARRGLLSQEELGRWLVYRELRQETAHECGGTLAENALLVISDFQRDAITLFRSSKQTAVERSSGGASEGFQGPGED